MVKTKEEAISVVSELLKELKAEFHIRDVYMYGSYADGTNSEDSDIDICLVIEGDVDYEKKLKIFSKVQKMNNRVEPFVFSEKEFDLDSSDIVYEIKRQGMKIV